MPSARRFSSNHFPSMLNYTQCDGFNSTCCAEALLPPVRMPLLLKSFPFILTFFSTSLNSFMHLLLYVCIPVQSRLLIKPGDVDALDTIAKTVLCWKTYIFLLKYGLSQWKFKNTRGSTVNTAYWHFSLVLVHFIFICELIQVFNKV